MILLIVVGLVIGLAVLGVGIYNGLVTLRNRVENAFAQIDVQLKRRHDLIPNLVETAKGYLKHERQTLEAVIAARNAAMNARERAEADPRQPGAVQQLSRAESRLAGALGRLIVVAEQYPDLKANQTMSQLMEELTSTENKIAFSRQGYNDSVMRYNVAREKFPNMIVANQFDFREAELFEIEDPAEAKVPSVSFA